ncbi:hypothetical protein Glove_609g25 [Diversispora epigaea]|uniref:Uncharacterized protein n=1 Tax=Diversispora epigaea TaxID=1348612 RepID=A0A397GAN0_9GLOM|nr:hypothetical protein Glove_609g25 [Diversispora epigaea]
MNDIYDKFTNFQTNSNTYSIFTQPGLPLPTTFTYTQSFPGYVTSYMTTLSGIPTPTEFYIPPSTLVMITVLLTTPTTTPSTVTPTASNISHPRKFLKPLLIGLGIGFAVLICIICIAIFIYYKGGRIFDWVVDWVVDRMIKRLPTQDKWNEWKKCAYKDEEAMYPNYHKFKVNVNEVVDHVRASAVGEPGSITYKLTN